MDPPAVDSFVAGDAVGGDLFVESTSVGLSMLLESFYHFGVRVQYIGRLVWVVFQIEQREFDVPCAYVSRSAVCSRRIHVPVAVRQVKLPLSE